MNRTALFTAVAITGAGAVGGVTYAAVSTPAAATSGAVAASTPAPAQGSQGSHGRAHARAGGGGLLRRLEHGQLTLRGRAGDRTVDLQRGAVTDVSPASITVKSADGFTHTYTLSSATKVRKDNSRAGIASVHDGDTVLVVANGSAAQRIVDRS